MRRVIRFFNFIAYSIRKYIVSKSLNQVHYHMAIDANMSSRSS